MLSVAPYVLFFLPLAAAYDFGEDVTLCWASNTSVPGSAVREDCAGAEVAFVDLDALPAILSSTRPYSLSYRIFVPAARGLLSTGVEDIPHANLHSCVRAVGFCTPFVADQPGLATHTEALSTEIGAGGNVTLRSEFSLDPGAYTIIAHARWLDVRGRQHDMARATYRDFVRPVDWFWWHVAIALGSALSLLIACLLALLCRNARRRYHSLRQLEERAFKRRMKRVLRECGDSMTLAFPMCLVSYANFRRYGRLVTYETAREAGDLCVCDNGEDVHGACALCIVHVHVHVTWAPGCQCLTSLSVTSCLMPVDLANRCWYRHSVLMLYCRPRWLSCTLPTFPTLGSSSCAHVPCLSNAWRGTRPGPACHERDPLRSSSHHPRTHGTYVVRSSPLAQHSWTHATSSSSRTRCASTRPRTRRCTRPRTRPCARPHVACSHLCRLVTRDSGSLPLTLVSPTRRMRTSTPSSPPSTA